jgi:general stress protein YciG
MANEHGKRGFGAMSDEKQRESASKGGKAGHGGQASQEKENKNAGSRGGSEEQHVRAGEQSHKNR